MRAYTIEVEDSDFTGLDAQRLAFRIAKKFPIRRVDIDLINLSIPPVHVYAQLLVALWFRAQEEAGRDEAYLKILEVEGPLVSPFYTPQRWPWEDRKNPGGDLELS